MDISELVDEILERVEGDSVSSDPYIERRILHSDLHNLIEKYDDENDRDTADKINSNLEEKLKDLEEDYNALESENFNLQKRIWDLEAEDD